MKSRACSYEEKCVYYLMIGTLFVRAFGDHLGITTHRDKELLVALGLSSSETDRQTDRQPFGVARR